MQDQIGNSTEMETIRKDQMAGNKKNIVTEMNIFDGLIIRLEYLY